MITRSPLIDPQPPERAGQHRRAVAQLAIGVAALDAGHGTVVDQRRLITAATLDMPVERVVAGVQPAAGEPAVDGSLALVQGGVGWLDPLDRGRPLHPEPVRIVLPAAIRVGVGHDRELTRKRGSPCSCQRRFAARPPALPRRHRRGRRRSGSASGSARGRSQSCAPARSHQRPRPRRAPPDRLAAARSAFAPAGDRCDAAPPAPRRTGRSG